MYTSLLQSGREVRREGAWLLVFDGGVVIEWGCCREEMKRSRGWSYSGGMELYSPEWGMERSRLDPKRVDRILFCRENILMTNFEL